MKIVKSLLLGSAAGLLAVAAAQAADMPVKAAPVEYVKICSLYGAGFYYIPGTDTCVKIGGYVRFEAVNTQNPSDTPFFHGVTDNQNTLLYTSRADFAYRARAKITMDTRSQTEWGTVRTYMDIGYTLQNPQSVVDRELFPAGAGIYTQRAFIQWAGFTFGRAQSFYDFISQASYMYWNAPSHDTGDQGTLLAAYTTQWGNGMSTTLSAESPRRAGIYNTDAALSGGVSFQSGYPIGVFWNNDDSNYKIPDIVSNFRIDQAWGSFQVMSALHQVRTAYYAIDGNNCNLGTTITGAMNCGSPGEKWGWAAGVGASFNLPFIAKGDTLAFQVNVSEGASVYVNNNKDPKWWDGSYSIGSGWLSDAILRATVPGEQAGSVELTKAWGFVAAYQHFWTPALRTSWYGGGYQVDYNSNATAYICDVTSLSTVQYGSPSEANPLCNPDHAVWYVGTRTQWNIRPDFYIGVDLLYSKMETAHKGAWAELAANGARPASPADVADYKFEDQDNLAIRFRVQRDIVP